MVACCVTFEGEAGVFSSVREESARQAVWSRIFLWWGDGAEPPHLCRLEEEDAHSDRVGPLEHVRAEADAYLILTNFTKRDELHRQPTRPFEGAAHGSDSARARAFNDQLRVTVVAVAGAFADGHEYGFLCECGCGGTVMLVLADYDLEGGAWVEGHRPTVE